MDRDGTLAIYASVPLYRDPGGGLLLEDQACNGLRLWAANFARVIALMPMADGQAPAAWVPVDDIGPARDRVEFVPLPVAWTPGAFLRALPGARRRIRAALARADYISLAIGGLIGDWGSVACIEAHRMGLPHAVWTDRVESAVAAAEARTAPRLARRLRLRVTAPVMARLERRLIGKATVGLFHGAETHAAYAPFARAAEVVHDIHLKAADHIAPAALAAKRAAAAVGPLRIVYVGRADAMKGPRDWVAAMAALAARGIDFTAAWLGDGAERAAMQAAVQAAGLAGRVALPGFVRDREAVFGALRAAHVFAFCHKTPESPRVLIEALASGTPIAGYRGAFAADLIAAHGGGILTPRDDPAALADAIAALAADRARLSDLIGRAAADAAPLTDEAVFRHRSAVIRRHLGPVRQRR